METLTAAQFKQLHTETTISGGPVNKNQRQSGKGLHLTAGAEHTGKAGTTDCMGSVAAQLRGMATYLAEEDYMAPIKDRFLKSASFYIEQLRLSKKI